MNLVLSFTCNWPTDIVFRQAHPSQPGLEIAKQSRVQVAEGVELKIQRNTIGAVMPKGTIKSV